ncbi:MAG: HsdM family class I SAM-dependent methyltransferase [Candidatus Helarchaeota archaeon]
MKEILDTKKLIKFFGINSTTFNYFNKKLMEFILNNQDNEQFSKNKGIWRDKFKLLYNSQDLTNDLFIIHHYIITLSRIILEEKFGLNIGNKFNILGLNFDWYINVLELDEWVRNEIRKYSIQSSPILVNFYQELVSKSIRHSMGEFYTPDVLARFMIKKKYKYGTKVLDPACGSGIFLIEIIKEILNSKLPVSIKKNYINKIFGIEINPIACLISKINVALILCELIEIQSIDNIFLGNSLDPSNKIIKKIGKVDLIIGNPPWLVYRDIESINFQELIKKIADINKIKPSAKDISNLEMAIVFFYEVPRLFLRKNGEIFFVMTSNILNSSQSSKFRNFYGFKNLEIYNFSKKFFKMKSICLYGIYSNESLKPFPIKIKYFNEKLQIIHESQLVPAYLEGENVRKLISINDKNRLIKISKSFYYNKVFKGADLFPRALLYASVKKVNSKFSIINKDLEATIKSKSKWNDKYYENIEIENDFVFDVLKADLLLPFTYKKLYKVILPIDKNYKKIPIENLPPKMKSFYKKIDLIYRENKKENTKFSNLWENINYQNKLINQNPNLYKVVFNEAGNKLKSAVIKKNIIIDYTLLYYQTANIDECYYLCSILNSEFLNFQLSLIKSSRHYVKRPFKFPIPIFDPLNEKHLRLVELSKTCEKLIKEKKHKNNYNLIIKEQMNEINKIVKEIVI